MLLVLLKSIEKQKKKSCNLHVAPETFHVEPINGSSVSDTSIVNDSMKR
jgi:hypothetical protein